MSDIQRGVIEGFQGTWGSGLGFLVVSGVPVPCDNGSTVRALEGCFGDVIGPAHSVDNVNGGHIGKEIFYSLDDMGMILEAFTPVDEAPPELMEAWEKSQV